MRNGCVPGLGYGTLYPSSPYALRITYYASRNGLPIHLYLHGPGVAARGLDGLEAQLLCGEVRIEVVHTRRVGKLVWAMYRPAVGHDPERADFRCAAHGARPEADGRDVGFRDKL